MTHQEYIKQIDRQRSLINRLFKNREKRSKEIQEITSERYSELIGKFFKANDNLKYLEPGHYFYIVGISTSSNYICSDRVEIKLICQTLSEEIQSTDNGWMLSGLSIYTRTLTFEPEDDIVSLIEPMIVSKEEAMSHFEGQQNKLMENFLEIENNG